MKSLCFKTPFLLFFFILGRNAYACNIAPGFNTNTTHTCGLPYIVKAVNTSSGTQNSTAKYWWKINHVKVSDTIIGLDSLSFLLKQVGNNVIKLYVKDSSGCIDSSARTINVSSSAKGIVDQNLNPSLNPVWMNCLQFITDPDTFRVNIQSSDTLKSLKIFWGDGSSDTSGTNLNPNAVRSHLFSSLGIFTIKIVTVNGSCIDTVYGTVFNQRQPTAGIIGPQSGSNRGCVPHIMRIVNNSYNISDNTNFIVDWGNGDFLSLPHTAANDTLYHTYRKGVCSGVIKITATNVCGSSFTTWNPIDISDRDKALWSVNTTCDPTNDHIFNNLSTDLYCLTPDIKEYFWDFGDGTTVGWTNSKAAQYHKYKDEGDYTVTLIAKSACGNDTFRGKVQVFYNPVSAFAFSSDRGCSPLSVTVIDTSKGRNYTRLWTITEGDSVFNSSDSILNYTFTQAGNNTISLRVTNKCTSSILTKTFRVNAKPSASFAKINGSCVPVTVQFDNTTTSFFNNPSFTWDFGDSTFSNLENPNNKVYAVPGDYTIKLIVSDSCGSDTFEQIFTAYGMPQAIFTADTSGCTFDSISFNNSSINSTVYNWDFGDLSTLQTTNLNPVKHVFVSSNNYTIRLIAGTGAGCMDTAYHNLFIKPGAKALFDINQSYGCAPATFTFQNNSIYGKDYNWYANGNLVSTGNTPNDTIIYTDSTVLTMKLIATSASSCQSDSLVKVFFTPKNPKAIIGNLDSGCGPLTVNFQNQSTNYVNSYWSLGNGFYSFSNNPTSIYPASSQADSIFNIQLRVSNWAGCKDSIQSFVKVFPKPKADFSLSTNAGCGPLTVDFTNLSKTNNNSSFGSLTHAWKFGDGSNSSQVDPQHAFSNSTLNDVVYTTSLKITTNTGCKDSISKTIKIYPKPILAFTPDKISGCALLPVNFSNQSKPGDTGKISIMNFVWNSGNGKTSSSKDFNAVFAGHQNKDSIYKVKLIGYSEHGCVDSLTKNITVHPQPIATFGLNKMLGCTPLVVNSRNFSKSMDGGPLTHDWDYGNGFKSTNKIDTTVYINTGNTLLTFTVRYQAISQYGCRDTATSSVIVRPKPKADFDLTGTKGCAPLLVTATDKSLNPYIYYWGEGDSVKQGAVNENFILPGLPLFDTLYILKHFVVSAFGCASDTIYKQVMVMGRPDANFEFSADSVCARQNINLVNTTLGAYQYVWKFGDNTSSTQVNPKHSFPKLPNNGRDTSFIITLEARSPSNCRDTIQKPIHMVNRPVEKLEFDKSAGCTDLEVNFSHSSKSFKTLYWDFGDNTPYATEDSVKHIFVNPLQNLTMQPKIALYRQRFNCLDTAYTNIFVYPKPLADFKTQRNDPCDVGNYQFINKSKFNSSSEWIIDETTIISVSSFSTILPSSNTKDTFYNIKLFVKNNYQCIDSNKQVIQVKPKMNISFEASSILACEKGTVDFVNTSINGVRYFWSFGDGGLSNEVNPTYVYNKFGIKKVMLFGYDKDGCVDSSDGSTIINVLEKPVADFSFLPAMPKLPNAIVNFTSKPLITSANVDDLIYEWNFGDATFPTNNKNEKHPTHTYYTAGNREVSLTVSNKICSDIVKKPIFIEDPKPEISFSADTTEGCASLRVQFKNNTLHATSYRWVWGDGSPDSYEKEPSHIFKFAGQWDVTLIATGTGGTSSQTLQYMIKVLPKPDADFFTNKQFLNLPNAIFSMQNISNNAIRYNWFLYDTFNNVIDASNLRDPSFVVNETGSYSVKLIAYNSFGCSDTMLKINYLGTFKEGYVYTPNAFTPNKNGRNDGFKPSTYNVKNNNFKFVIYNRWGEKVFETNDQTEEWDGTFNGVLCAQDVYVWTVNGEFINGDEFAFRGTVTLLQ